MGVIELFCPLLYNLTVLEEEPVFSILNSMSFFSSVYFLHICNHRIAC
jgi:hypothetical protein